MKPFLLTLEEVNDPICDLKASKRTLPSSLPTTTIKQLNVLIASALVELASKSFQNGFLPCF